MPKNRPAAFTGFPKLSPLGLRSWCTCTLYLSRFLHRYSEQNLQGCAQCCCHPSVYFIMHNPVLTRWKINKKWVIQFQNLFGDVEKLDEIRWQRMRMRQEHSVTRFKKLKKTTKNLNESDRLPIKIRTARMCITKCQILTRRKANEDSSSYITTVQ
jgi:hypothetical protein